MKRYGLNHWQARGICLVALVVAAQPQAAKSQDAWQPVWTIGVFNESSGEFHSGAVPTPAEPYVIGKSAPGKNWFAFQPGSANGSFGHQPHPATQKGRPQERITPTNKGPITPPQALNWPAGAHPDPGRPPAQPRARPPAPPRRRPVCHRHSASRSRYRRPVGASTARQ